MVLLQAVLQPSGLVMVYTAEMDCYDDCWRKEKEKEVKGKKGEKDEIEKGKENEKGLSFPTSFSSSLSSSFSSPSTIPFSSSSSSFSSALPPLPPLPSSPPASSPHLSDMIGEEDNKNGDGKDREKEMGKEPEKLKVIEEKERKKTWKERRIEKREKEKEKEKEILLEKEKEKEEESKEKVKDVKEKNGQNHEETGSSLTLWESKIKTKTKTETETETANSKSEKRNDIKRIVLSYREVMKKYPPLSASIELKTKKMPYGSLYPVNGSFSQICQFQNKLHQSMPSDVFLSYWLQCYFGGIERIFLGYRENDEARTVNYVEWIDVEKIPMKNWV